MVRPQPTPRKKQISGDGSLLIDSARKWAAHRASSKGAALALYMVFSLAPMLIFVIAMAGAFFGEETVRLELFSHLRDFIGERGADLIQSVLASAHDAGNGRLAALVSLAMMVFSATTAFSELKASLDKLWQTPPKALKGWKSLIYSRLLSFGLVLTLAFFLLLSLMLNAGLQITRS